MVLIAVRADKSEMDSYKQYKQKFCMLTLENNFLDNKNVHFLLINNPDILKNLKLDL